MHASDTDPLGSEAVNESAESLRVALSGRANRLTRSKITLASLAGVVVALDQTTKAVVRATLPLHDSVEVIPNFLSFTYVRNTGAAFGLLNGVDFPLKTAVMTMVALTALVAIGVYAAKTAIPQRATRLGLALVIGGAVGNLIDRITFGYVVDFIDAYWRGWHFWAFNVADAAITIGASLLILDMIWMDRHVSRTV
jgi:signal peptidase II